MATLATNTDIILDLCDSCTLVLATGADPADVGMSEDDYAAYLEATRNLRIYGPGVRDDDMGDLGACDVCQMDGPRTEAPADYR